MIESQNPKLLNSNQLQAIFDTGSRTFFVRPDASLLGVIGQAVCQRAASYSVCAITGMGAPG
jgi:hypothetical protein